MSSSPNHGLHRIPLIDLLASVSDVGSPRPALGARQLPVILPGHSPRSWLPPEAWSRSRHGWPAWIETRCPRCGSARVCRFPSGSTIRRTLAPVDGDDLDRRMGAWMAARVGALEGRRVIAIDGKSMRGVTTNAVMPHQLAALDHVEVEATWGTSQRMIGAYPRPRSSRRQGPHARGDRRRQRQCAGPTEGGHHPGPDSEEKAATSWPTSTGPAPATDPPKRSTAASNTCAAPPSGSATSPATWPDLYSRPAAADHDYTLVSDETVCVTRVPTGST